VVDGEAVDDEVAVGVSSGGGVRTLKPAETIVVAGVADGRTVAREGDDA